MKTGLFKIQASQRLSVKVLLYIVICSMFFTIISAGYELYTDYRQDLKEVENLLLQIEKSHQQSLSTLLWDLDKDKLEVQIKGIMALANAQYVRVTEISQGKERDYLSIGAADAKNLTSQKFPLEYETDSVKKHIGTFYIGVSLDEINKRIYSKFSLIILAKIIEIFLWSLLILIIFQRLIIRHLNTMVEYVRKFDFDNVSHNKPLTLARKEIRFPDSLDMVTEAINGLRSRLIAYLEEIEEQNILKSDQARLANILAGNKDIDKLASDILTFLARYTDSQLGLFYTLSSDNVLSLVATYGVGQLEKPANNIEIGEGLVGQAALNRQTMMISELPDDYMKITSSLVELKPRNALLIPVTMDTLLQGAIELASVNEFSDKHTKFIASVNERMAITINAASARAEKAQLLKTE